MADRCPACDRADCPTLADLSWQARRDCRRHAVDWRARALAAERRDLTMTPTKEEIRDEAITILAICASSRNPRVTMRPPALAHDIYSAATESGASERARELARDVFRSVASSQFGAPMQEIYAEAEARLQTGEI